MIINGVKINERAWVKGQVRNGGHWNGFQIVETELMTLPAETLTFRRTWRERLLTFPWHPMRKWRHVTLPPAPRNDLIVSHELGRIYCHPTVAAKLRELSKARDSMNLDYNAKG